MWLRYGVAVLAIDPSSPFTGGALLGDRIRMEAVALDRAQGVQPRMARGASYVVEETLAGLAGHVRHDILIAYFHIVRDQVPFRELGPDWQRVQETWLHTLGNLTLTGVIRLVRASTGIFGVGLGDLLRSWWPENCYS